MDFGGVAVTRQEPTGGFKSGACSVATPLFGVGSDGIGNADDDRGSAYRASIVCFCAIRGVLQRLFDNSLACLASITTVCTACRTDIGTIAISGSMGQRVAVFAA